jgi:hypothetical protein
MPFATDLKFGQIYESKLVEYLKPDQFIQSEGNCKGWDLKMVQGGNTLLYEVKADRLTWRTNYLCIEYACNDEPSGIELTEADIYAIFEVGTNSIYLIPVPIVKQAIVDGKFSRKMAGGDKWRSRFYLFPKIIFEEYKKNIKNED